MHLCIPITAFVFSPPCSPALEANMAWLHIAGAPHLISSIHWPSLRNLHLYSLQEFPQYGISSSPSAFWFICGGGGSSSHSSWVNSLYSLLLHSGSAAWQDLSCVLTPEWILLMWRVLIATHLTMREPRGEGKTTYNAFTPTLYSD